METRVITYLKEAGSRITPARVAVLGFLITQKHPVGIERIQKANTSVNTVTLYRMMTDFVERGLVHVHDVGHGHQDYEFAKRAHHHHLICEKCGKIEDTYPCKETCLFEKATLAASAQFKKVTRQVSAFYGLCRKCA